MTPSFPQINFADPAAPVDGAAKLVQEQHIARPRGEVFAFFSDPENLQKLTPPWLGFEFVSLPDEMRSGALIEYKLSLHGVPLSWKTRIEEWVPGERFVDTQIAGPYSLWHHTHEFEDADDDGTLIRDTVRYRVPFGPLGSIVRRTLVAPDTRKIFAYRREAIEREF